MLCKGGKKMDLSAKAIYASVLANLSFLGAALLSALGGWDFSLQFLIGIMAADYVLGVLIALVWHKSQKSADGTFESNASLKGLLRKMSVLLVVYVAVQLDVAANTDGYLRTAVILFFTANEGFSVFENLGIMGVPLPPAVKNAFAAMKQQGEKIK